MMMIHQAERILTAIQRKRTARCRLHGDDVTVEAIPGNAFRITGPSVKRPDTLESYARLSKFGAELRVEPDEDGEHKYVTELTWDSTLHFLVRTEDLTPA